MSITNEAFRGFNELLKEAHFSGSLILYIGGNAFLISLLKEAIYMYYENYSVVGIVNGQKIRFATEEEYQEYIESIEEEN